PEAEAQHASAGGVEEVEEVGAVALDDVEAPVLTEPGWGRLVEGHELDVAAGDDVGGQADEVGGASEVDVVGAGEVAGEPADALPVGGGLQRPAALCGAGGDGAAHVF